METTYKNPGKLLTMREANALSLLFARGFRAEDEFERQLVTEYRDCTCYRSSGSSVESIRRLCAYRCIEIASILDLKSRLDMTQIKLPRILT